MEKTYCIYCHTNKINGKKYVGMTSQSLENRWRKGKGYKHCEAIEQAFIEYGWDNFDHEVLAEGLLYEEACEAEKRFIKELGCRFPEGYNIDGGGRKNRDIATRTKDKIRQYHLGKTNSPAARAKISAANKGKIVSEKTRELLSKKLTGKVRTDEQRANMSAAKKKLLSENKQVYEGQAERLRGYAKKLRRPVLQFTKDGKFVTKHDSVSEAAESVNGKVPNIVKCCSGVKKSMYGYVWKYESEVTA